MALPDRLPALPAHPRGPLNRSASAQVAAAIGAKDALQATKDVRTLIAVDDYNVLYSHTGESWFIQLKLVYSIATEGVGSDMGLFAGGS